MLDKPGYVVLTEASNTFQAQFLAGALESEGIPTHVDGDHLADEFAMSQKMLGLIKVRVMVPEDRLEDARAILATLKDAGPADGDEVPWDTPDGETS
jgi:hypothetical protein